MAGIHFIGPSPLSYNPPAAAPAAFVPSYSPYAYWDGLNASNSTGNWVEGINGGTGFDLVTARGTVTYNASGYFEFGGSDDIAVSGGSLTDVLQTLGSRAHTVIVVFNSNANSNNDILGNVPGNNSILLQCSPGVIRGHIWNASGTLAVGNGTAMSNNAWYFGGQRSEITGGNFQLSVFETLLTTATPSFTTIGTVAQTSPGTGIAPFTVGQRGNDNQWFNGEMAQLVVYDKYLTDAEIETVRGELATHTGL